MDVPAPKGSKFALLLTSQSIQALSEWDEVYTNCLRPSALLSLWIQVNTNLLWKCVHEHLQ
jgi:hypothetical protein